MATEILPPFLDWQPEGGSSASTSTPVPAAGHLYYWPSIENLTGGSSATDLDAQNIAALPPDSLIIVVTEAEGETHWLRVTDGSDAVTDLDAGVIVPENYDPFVYPYVLHQQDIGGGGGGTEVSASGVSQLIFGTSFLDVIFSSEQSNADWGFIELDVVNTVDAEPLNIWPGLVTIKSTTGFRIFFNGEPDSSNYFLHWAISGVSVPPTPATAYTLSGPSSGDNGSPSTNFTVALSGGTTVPGPVTVTMDDGGDGGVFTPTTVELTTASPSATFTYTPATAGVKTISATNDGGLIDPASVNYTSFSITDAHAYTLSGPSTGFVSAASTNFTVAISGGTTLPAPVTVTPSDGGAGGTFTPTTVSLSTGTPSATFTYTPSAIGAKTISCTNDGGLTNPSNLTYTATAPAIADGDPVSSWPDSSGNGHTATMTGASRPIYKAAIVNGNPVVRFTVAGTSGLNVAIPFVNPTTFTMVAVMKGASAAATIRTLGSSTDSGGAYGVVSIGTGGDLVAMSSQSQSGYFTPNPYITGWHIYKAEIAPGAAGFYVDGTNAGGIPFAVTETGDLDTIGYCGPPTPAYSDGDIAEVIIWLSGAIPTGPEFENIVKGLGIKYGIATVGGTAGVPPDYYADPAGWWKADAIT